MQKAVIVMYTWTLTINLPSPHNTLSVVRNEGRSLYPTVHIPVTLVVVQINLKPNKLWKLSSSVFRTLFIVHLIAQNVSSCFEGINCIFLHYLPAWRDPFLACQSRPVPIAHSLVRGKYEYVDSWVWWRDIRHITRDRCLSAQQAGTSSSFHLIAIHNHKTLKVREKALKTEVMIVINSLTILISPWKWSWGIHFRL